MDFFPHEKTLNVISYKLWFSEDCSCWAYTEQIPFQAEERLSKIFPEITTHYVFSWCSEPQTMEECQSDLQKPAAQWLPLRADARFWMGKEASYQVYKAPTFNLNPKKNSSTNC